jgi:uncharacterized membrane protein
MDIVEKRLRATLYVLMIVGLLQSLIVGAVMGILASDSGSWMIAVAAALLGFTIIFPLMFLLPRYAIKALDRKQTHLAIIHSLLVMIFMSYIFPISLAIGAWELALCFRLKRVFSADRIEP